jgi:MFS transporter, DHA2 family, multidrug resistance protein
VNQAALIGFAGVIVAAMSTELNASVSALSLPDIAGHLGLSRDSTTWFISLYTSAEVMGMALGPWFAVTLTLRRFTLFIIGLACLSTLLIPWSGHTTWLFSLRVVQGLCGGFTIPILMTTALRVLGPPVRLYGLAAYALTATFFPNLSATVSALWTEYVNWHFIFLQSIPLSALAAVLVWYGLPQDAPQYARFRIFDWRGAVLLIVGLGSLTTMLLQGDRLDWFRSSTIWVLALASVVAIPLLIWNEWHQEVPLLKLQMLRRRNFAYTATGLFLLIIASTLSSLLIPFADLTQVQGYRPLQAQLISLEIAASQLILLPLMAFVLDWKWLDARWVSFIGMCAMLAACIGASFLDSGWNRDQFYLWQGFLAVGTPMIVVPLLMMGTNTVKPPEGPFAAALINTPRAIADACSVWLFTLIIRLRGNLHSERITDHLGAVRFRLIQGFGSPHMPAFLLPDGHPRQADSLRQLNQLVRQQVLVLTLSDAFLVVGCIVVGLMLILLVLPVRPYPPRIALMRQ